MNPLPRSEVAGTIPFPTSFRIVVVFFSFLGCKGGRPRFACEKCGILTLLERRVSQSVIAELHEERLSLFKKVGLTT